MKKVLVAGATGYLGQYVLREFKKQGCYVRALSRKNANRESIESHVDEMFYGDATNADSLKGICDGIDIVFSSIGITRQRDGLSYMDVDYQGNMNLLEQAVEANVKKFLYISALNAEKLDNLKIIKAKNAFVEKLKTSGVNHIIIYPNGFFSDMLEMLKMAKRGRGYFFGKGNYRCNPIHGADLARFCVEVSDSSETEFSVGGPDILTHRRIFELACEALGKKAHVTGIPNWMRLASLWTLRTFTSEKTYGPLEFFLSVMAMDMVAEPFGETSLKDFFVENAGSV